MPKFSRWMPPAAAEESRGPSVLAWAAVALLAAGPLALVVVSRAARVGLATLIVVLVAVTVADRRRFRAMVAARAGEDIGTFARAIDRRSEAFDPWVVRAIWEALRAETRDGGVELPLRPGDRITEDLRIDWDDIDLGVLPTVAARTGRVLTVETARANPMCGRVYTVADLIRFVALQPRRAAA